KGTAVFMSQDPDGTPPALLHQLKHKRGLHEQVVILTIQTADSPVVPVGERVEIRQIGRGFWRVVARYGFMETPRVPDVMRCAAAQGLETFRGRTSYFLGRETFGSTGRSALPGLRRALVLV